MGTKDKGKRKTWKQKGIERSQENKRLRASLKRQTNRAIKWRNKYYMEKRDSVTTKVKNHKYPLELMWMAIWMHIGFNISLRGVSQSLCKFASLYGLSIDYISPSSIRNWCLKFGLYSLTSIREPGKYVIICDGIFFSKFNHSLLF